MTAPIRPTWTRRGTGLNDVSARFYAHDTVITLRVSRECEGFVWEFQHGGTCTTGIKREVTPGLAMQAAENAWRDWARKTAEAAGWTVTPPADAKLAPSSPDPTVIVNACGLPEAFRLMITDEDRANGYVVMKRPDRDVNTVAGEIRDDIRQKIKEDLDRIRAEADRIEFEKDDQPLAMTPHGSMPNGAEPIGGPAKVYTCGWCGQTRPCRCDEAPGGPKGPWYYSVEQDLRGPSQIEYFWWPEGNDGTPLHARAEITRTERRSLLGYYDEFLIPAPDQLRNGVLKILKLDPGDRRRVRFRDLRPDEYING